MVAPRSPTVLLVEDDPALRRTAMRVFEGRLACHLILAENAEEALARIDLGQPVDLVLSDLNLPGMDGLGLYQQLRARGFLGKFVLTSGSQPEDIARERVIPPEVVFLPRPWTIDEAIQVIRTALGDS